MKKRSRPVVHMPRTPLETRLEVLAALGVIAVIALTAWGWLTLPAIIPVHYNLAGEPNAYGGKDILLLLPILATCVAVLLTVVGRFPRSYNYPWPITVENAARQYGLARLVMRWLNLEIIWSLCGMQWILIQAARSEPGDAILLYVGAMMLVLLGTIIWYVLAAARAR